MKRCPECLRDYYDDTLLYCLDDGAPLLDGPASEGKTAVFGSDSSDESKTAILSEHPSLVYGLSPAESDTQFLKVGQGGDRRPPDNRTLSLSDTGYFLGWMRSRKKVLVVAALASLGLIGGGFGAYRFWGKLDKPKQTIKIEKLTTNGKAVDAAISPDGKYVVYIVDEDGKQSLWTRQVATSSNVQIVPPSDMKYRSLSFTPDGNFINFVKIGVFPPNALYQIPVHGGAQKKLLEDGDRAISFSPNGKQFAFVRNDYPKKDEGSLLIANSDGTDERILASLPDDFPAFDGIVPAWAPDGKTIACISFLDIFKDWKVVEVRVSDGKVTPLVNKGWIGIKRVGWLPDKSGLLILGVENLTTIWNQQLWRISYPEGAAQRITNDSNNYVGMSLSADSSILAAVQSSRLSSLWAVPIDDASRAVQVKSLGMSVDGEHALAWTPDGKIIYYSQAGGGHDIWIMNGDGSGQKQLTSDAGANYEAKVAPDGRFIVFTSNRDSNENIWRMDLDGGNLRQLTTGNSDTLASVSPDSRWVVYSSKVLGDEKLWKVSIDGGDAVQLTDYPSYNPKISPDGKFIACEYRTDPSQWWRYAIIPIDGGKPVKILDLSTDNHNLRWSKDSRSLLYKDKNAVSNIWSFPLDDAPPKQLTDFKTDQIYNFDLSADGKQLVVARGTTISDVVLISNFR